VDVLAADAVEKMKHWIGKGFSGMRLFTTGSTMPDQAMWFDDPRTFPAWDYAGSAGIPVCMQMTPPGFPRLRGLLDRFKDVRIILDHLARPALVDGPPYAADREFLDLSQNKNVFLKLTPLNVTPENWGKATPETFFRALIDRFGADRIAWGSNFPATNDSLAGILGKAQAALAHASAEERSWIFGKTAQRLYPLLKD
jgi:predicted TIM-barrel fold metal-dependent hydrolase